MELDFSGMAPTNVVVKPTAPVRAHQPRANPGARAGNTYIAAGVVLIRDACSIKEPYPKMYGKIHSFCSARLVIKHPGQQPRQSGHPTNSHNRIGSSENSVPHHPRS